MAQVNNRVEAEDWISALGHVSHIYGLSLSAGSARASAHWDNGSDLQSLLGKLARASGLRLSALDPARTKINSWELPVIVQLRDGSVGVMTALSARGQATIVFHGDADGSVQIDAESLFPQINAILVARPNKSARDARVDSYIKPYQPHWLRRLILRHSGAYGHVFVASFIANLLGLTGVLFSMQVYDRVVPAQSFPTLYVLFSGVLLAIAFDYVMRHMRAGVVDFLGKDIDLRLSDRIMGHALRVTNKARPKSTGTFLAQIRDLEQVREMLTSTTIVALADLPFFFLFLVIFWYIAGWLVLLPLAAMVLMLLPAMLSQGRLRQHAQSAMREGSLRNAVLLEAIQGIEDIKTLQAEDRFQRQWNHLNQVTGEAQLKLRGLLSALNTWTHCVQMAVFASVIFFGAPMIMSGDMTTGALVAASILGSRMIAPMSQFAQLMSRVQHAKTAAQSLDQIMKLPIDNPADEVRVQSMAIAGNFRLRNAAFHYGEEGGPPALTVDALSIRAGEKIALLGRNGAGKSTLLQALSGMVDASSGEILLDDIVMHHIDPADIRRDIGLLTQNARLFHGTLRENLLMGAPSASQDQLFEALAMVGAESFVRRLPKGLDHMLLEGGQGLSGGQKQSLLLARLFIRQPQTVLLDEPTASMDDETEREFIRHFSQWASGRTVVIATHRLRVLELVDRIIVLEQGRITLDEPRDRALIQLRKLSPVGATNRVKRPHRAVGAHSEGVRHDNA